jgi:hypothetical protein
MTEIDKLEKYLKEIGAKYERTDTEEKRDEIGRIEALDCHQIIVFDDNGKRLWDVVCHRGSYGWEQGLLEAYGKIVESRDVVGCLTAEKIIEVLKRGGTL